MFNRFRSTPTPATSPTPVDTPGGSDLQAEHLPDGTLYRRDGVAPADWLDAPYAYADGAETAARLAQLRLDGLGQAHEDGWLLRWDEVHALLVADDTPSATAHQLRLPSPGQLRPAVGNKGSLGDADFALLLTGWQDGTGQVLRQPPDLVGSVALLPTGAQLLPAPSWRIVCAVRAFHQTPAAQRDQAFREAAWANLRCDVDAAGAPMSDYLARTRVLTPSTLRLDFRRETVGAEALVEIIPGFDGAPEGWLSQFDRMPVRAAYDVPDGPALTRILVSDAAREVLSEIKACPGRRVAGARAEAFIRNPVAALGPSAAQVLDPAQIDRALQTAGVGLYRFKPLATRDPQTQGLLGVSLDIIACQEADASGPDAPERLHFDGPEQLEAFCRRVSSRLQSGMQCCAWDGYDLELVGETPSHLADLGAWLVEWRDWQGSSLWSAAEVLDLSHYSDRIAGLGEEKAYAVPVLARKSVDLAWYGGNVMYAVNLTPAGGSTPQTVPLSVVDIDRAAGLIAEARQAGASEVTLPNASFPVPLADAAAAVGALQAANTEITQRRFSPDKGPQAARPKAMRAHLVLKSNIEDVDFVKNRADQLELPDGVQALLPQSLRPDVQLKPHQIEGLRWMQHLWSCSPIHCSGALLADDMGLGKTLQLLCFMAACFESDPGLPPALVVAPLALLENWKAEIDRFFQPGTLPLLTLYGDALKQARAPRYQVEDALRAHGVTRLLKRDWLGGAHVVLTTYETLRDLEFALSAQRWSIMICDEAQKIKTPGAMVTRTAKKQQVRFRIACTGTPVENTLMDLWCLFDFIQDGYLGALTSFSRTYRQPIEAKTEHQKQRLEKLRAMIAPQILRRTKQGVAKDILPAKREDEACRALAMSPRQAVQYQKALGMMLATDDGAAALKVLHHIRRICSDPDWQAGDQALERPLREVLADSPKMAWLVQLLTRLKRESEGRDPGEKVIVFCEFRDLQLQLQRVLHACFGLRVSIVNGDTSASLEVENSRQKLIDRFQRAHGFGVIILSPLAVGFGVNIQAANHVVHFTRTWNPAKEDQATDRAYRIGQTRDVTVYYPTVQGVGFKSFDTVLHELLSWKRGLAEDMLNGSGELSMAEIRQAMALDPE